MEPGESTDIENSSYLPLLVQFKIDDTQNKSIAVNEKTAEINVSMLSHAINMEIRSGTAIDDCFERLLRLYSEDEKSFKSILQVIYKIVKDFSQNQCPLSSNSGLTAGWAEILIDVLFSKTWEKTTVSDALLCLKLYLNTFCEGNIVHRLWQTLLNNTAKSNSITITSTAVFIQFFEEFSAVINDFERNRDLEKLVYKLLQSDGREERKAALYLMKKLNSHHDKNVKIFWISYITVFENLEENQSHLILPSLECLKQNHLKQVNLQKWLNILFIRILSHQNILVIRWALVYILETFTCAEMSSKVLLQFVKACNHTNLYNPENYYLSADCIQNFLSGELLRFMEIMSEVNLKSVPMHFWLAGIHKCKSNQPLYPYKLILKIAAKIRSLQNPFIRLKSIELFEDIIYETICKMPLSEYIVLVESLYNVSDPFINFEKFCCKLKTCFENCNEISLTQRFYEIVTNNLYGELTPIDLHLKNMQTDVNMKGQLNAAQGKLLDNVADSLINIDYSYKDGPNWILQMLVCESENAEVARNICQSFWNLNLDNFIGVPFETLSLELTSVLSCVGNTVAFVRQKCTDFFVKEYLMNFSDLQSYMVKAEDILNTGSHKTLLKLSKLLANNKEKVDASIIDEFLIVLKRFSRMPSLCHIVTTNLLKYLKNIYPSCQAAAYAEQLLCIDLENLGICAAILNSGVVLKKETYIKGIMIGDAYFGDERIEELYLLKICKMQCSRLQQIRLQYIQYFPDDYTNTILNELLSIQKTLSIKKPRYFENSMEHRLKMRIAKAILLKIQSTTEFWNEALLDLLLNHNNQLNINYIFELLVAKCAPNDELILKKLNEMTKYTPSQQVSLISVVHCYSFLNWGTLSKENLYTIVNKLLPLTMGAHFQTRLYAQLVIYSILDKSDTAGNDDPLLSNHINMQDAIALAVGPQLKELRNDVRMLLPNMYKNHPTDFYDIIMYIAMAPADEYLSNSDYSKYEASKYIFSKKKSNFTKETATPGQIGFPRTNLTNMQRKMNPENDLYTESSFIVSEIATEFEMIVVASLIDKNPNLGGIARTCEVLGIRNLVLSSRLLAGKEDFRSVSMTAENNLNIIEVRPTNLPEFFKEKEADGFKIIGAEQTVDSVNIISFEFPRKCVLVLGHEKEGIPSNILGFLDYTIEIPQFGLLRSLNVHVTGALFMWEYCKQHIVGNSSTTTSIKMANAQQ